MRLLRCVFLALAGSCSVPAQTYNISTIAGGGLPVNIPGTSAFLQGVGAVAVDGAGNVFFSTENVVLRLDAITGILSLVAGNGTAGFSGDNGPATSAQLSAGNGTRGFSGDNGPATSAQLGGPWAVAVDPAGNLYITDRSNSRIRKVSDGVIATVAGNGTRGFSGDNGPATNAQLDYPSSIAVDAVGNLYIADTNNNRIRKVSDGVITTVAGNGGGGNTGDNGPATSGQLSFPWAIAVDSTGGNLFIALYLENRIRRVSGGVITTVAGGGSTFGDNGPATSAQLSPFSVAVDSVGDVYVADASNNRVRLLQPQPPSIAAVTNAASNLSSASISPGEIITLYGISLGPSQLMQAGGGLFATQLAGASVTINGVPAPIIYTSASQTAVIVPYATTGATAQITLAYLGKTATFQVPVASSAPGVFTFDSTGKGPAAALNQDGVTVNTAANRAQVGDVISLFATGEGQTNPAGVDGKLAAAPLPKPLLPVTVDIGGQDAEILYAGGAPGAVAGLMQINVRIPSGIPTGAAVPVAVRVGNASSQAGVTIAVR